MASKRSFGQLRKLPSGRWQAGYTGPDLRVHLAGTTFTAKIDAEAWLAAERRIIESDEWTPPADRMHARLGPSLTLTTYAEGWLADRTLKPTSRAHYRKLLDRVILPSLGNRLLKAITPIMVRSWYAGLGTRTPTLRAHAYSLLRTILAIAVDEQLITANPLHIRGACNSKRVHRVRPATLAELEALTDAMPAKYRLMILLAAWCAMRFGELAELRRKDVDLTNGIIRIRRAVVRAAGTVIVGTPKSAAGVRDVGVPPHLLPTLKHHLDVFAAPGRDGLLFPAVQGGNLATSTCTSRSTRHGRQPGVPTCASTTFGTPAPSSRPQPAPRWLNSWPGWGRDRVIAESLSALASVRTISAVPGP